MNEQCARCHRPMVRGGRGQLPRGVVRHYARGECPTCSARSRTPYVAANRPLTYRGPSSDIDDVVVQRILAGDRTIACTNAEIRQAIAILDQRRLSARAIAEHLGTTTRSVQRYRARTRAVAA